MSIKVYVHCAVCSSNHYSQYLTAAAERTAIFVHKIIFHSVARFARTVDQFFHVYLRTDESAVETVPLEFCDYK